MTQYSSSALTNPMEFAYPEADAQAGTRKIQIRCLNARAIAEITLFDHFHYRIACFILQRVSKTIFFTLNIYYIIILQCKDVS
jgi:hypothetical protein